jgi:hypothetical protein
MDECRTLAEFDDRDEAIEYCGERNHKWKKHIERVRLGTASPTQIRTYFASDRYEFTEV